MKDLAAFVTVLLLLAPPATSTARRQVQCTHDRSERPAWERRCGAVPTFEYLRWPASQTSRSASHQGRPSFNDAEHAPSRRWMRPPADPDEPTPGVRNRCEAAKARNEARTLMTIADFRIRLVNPNMQHL